MIDWTHLHCLLKKIDNQEKIGALALSVEAFGFYILSITLPQARRIIIETLGRLTSLSYIETITIDENNIVLDKFRERLTGKLSFNYDIQDWDTFREDAIMCSASIKLTKKLSGSITLFFTSAKLFLNMPIVIT